MLFGILIACGLGIPIPEDLSLVVGGVLVSYEITHFWRTFFVCMTGVLFGDIFIYVLGRFVGDRLVRSKFFSRMIKAKYIAMVKLASEKYGNYLIFFARFLPGVRTLVYFSLGTFKKPFYLFFLIDGFAALISVPVWVCVGMFFGQNIPLLEHYMKNMKLGIYIALVVLLLLIVAFHMLNKKIIGLFFKRARAK